MLIELKEKILAIANEQGVTGDVALDMFIANMEKGEAGRTDEHWYKGANELNYDEIRVQWLEMNEGQRLAERAAFLESLKENEGDCADCADGCCSCVK